MIGDVAYEGQNSQDVREKTKEDWLGRGRNLIGGGREKTLEHWTSRRGTTERASYRGAS